MADDITLNSMSGGSTVKTTDNGSDHTQHVNVDAVVSTDLTAILADTAAMDTAVAAIKTTTDEVAGAINSSKFDANIVSVAGAAATSSNGTHDSTVGSALSQIGAEARSSEGTAVINTDAVRLMADLVGKLVSSPYAPSDLYVSGTATEASATTDEAVIAAGGAGIRTYVTTIVLANTSAVDTEALIRDGTSTMMTVPCKANSGATITLPCPLVGTANTAWNFQIADAATSVVCTLVGYQGR